MIEVEVRLAKPNDVPYIFKTWLRTFFKYSKFNQQSSSPHFFKRYQKVLEHIMLKPETSTLIVHPKGEPDILLGYLILEKQETSIVHFMFIKREFRQLGIAKQVLLKTQVKDGYFTHWTKWTDHTWGKFNLIFDPYRIL